MAIIIQNKPLKLLPTGRKQPDEPLYMSALGTPVYSNLHIEGGRYKNNQGEIIIYDQVIIDTVLFNLNMTKNIVKTSIQGSDNGSVKEYIGLSDYQISCSVIISSGQVNVHPWELESALNNTFLSPEPLTIFNAWLNRLGIHQIVITDFDMPQLAGEYSQANISFNALSDQPVLLLYDAAGNQNQFST